MASNEVLPGFLISSAQQAIEDRVVPPHYCAHYMRIACGYDSESAYELEDVGVKSQLYRLICPSSDGKFVPDLRQVLMIFCVDYELW